jgi:hypothetical protein
MRWPRILLLMLPAFALVLLLRLPLGWVRPLFPAPLKCAALAGTIWNGDCADLSWNDGRNPVMQLARVRWQVRLLPLFRAQLAAQLDVEHTTGNAQAQVVLGTGGRITVSGLALRSRIDHTLLPVLPPGWSGQLEVRDAALERRGAQLLGIRGTAHAMDIVDDSGANMGSYQLVMSDAAGPPFTGRLTSSGGPLDVQAAVRLAADMAWELEGTVAASTDASPALQQKLQVLGPPDATGRRRISVAGTF